MASNFHKMKKEIRNNCFVYFNSRLSCAKDNCVSLTSTRRQGLLVLRQAAILCHHLSTADQNCWAEVDFYSLYKKDESHRLTTGVNKSIARTKSHRPPGSIIVDNTFFF